MTPKDMALMTLKKMTLKYIGFRKLVSLARAGTPIEINGATYVAKKVEIGLKLGCCHCKLSRLCEGDLQRLCIALDTPFQSYYMEKCEG